MNSDEWDVVQRIFLHASELVEAERLMYVRKASQGNEQLYQAVVELLDADKDVPSYLENPPAWSGRFDPVLNTVIDAYQIVEEIGRGGMGQVYLARDLRTNDQVALKMVQGARHSSRLLKRFLLEQRVMARLDHPYIARLIEVGFWKEAIPYLVMEYVEGEPIVSYCIDRELSLYERLKLVRDVCTAIQYAHKNRVVHRDIKPSNILVKPMGQVKVLDFGIAKLLEENSVFETLTRTGERIMTPAYAAPEQLKGEPITRATDIYMLGVLLHEVITGERPGVSSTKKEMNGGLQRIIDKALQPNPSNRFGSAKKIVTALDQYILRNVDL
ncbi:MAG: serine/threonine protein kinase [Rhodothermaceae bacterium]|nr:serine/threonine protein kinase [Rhodothermaceae bacterium]